MNQSKNSHIDVATLEHLMLLSMIEIKKDQYDSYIAKISALKDFANTLWEANVDNIEPIYSPIEINSNVFREDDDFEAPLNHDKALGEAQGKFKDDNFFTIVNNR